MKFLFYFIVIYLKYMVWYGRSKLKHFLTDQICRFQDNHQDGAA